MSDYLTSLVQRARGETGAVRPIVQPVFAPVRADLPSLPGIATPEIPAAAPRTRAAARSAEAGPLPAEQSGPDDPRSAAPPLHPAASRLSPTPLPPTTAELQPSPALQYAVEHPTSANSPLSVAQHDSLAGLDAVLSPAEPSQAPAVAPLPTPARAGMPAIDSPVQQGTGELSVRRAREDAPDSESVTATPRPTAQVAARRQAGRTPASEQIIPVPREPDRPAARPAVASSPWVAAGNQAAGPPPTIRVSIGRIEVRAVLPAPPPPPPPVAAPAAPLVTLDAYLRERTGRRDR